MMSNRWIVLLSFAVVLFWLLSLTVETWHIRANEYFGDGRMIALIGEKYVVSIVQAWGIYIVIGKQDDCRILPIYSPVGDAAIVDCGILFNKKKTVFRGWYDFRGHPRPFCGALSLQNIPPQCKGD